MKKLLASLCLACFMSDLSAADSVFHPDKLPVITAAPGLTLQELVGKVAPARSQQHSVALFNVEKGATTGASYNKTAEETFLILSGKGHVALGKKRFPIKAGSVVQIPAKVIHSLDADAGEKIVFYAICAPAFDPTDYVLVGNKK